MMTKLLLWDIYEITSDQESLNGVMLRGRLRKLGINKEFNILVENAEDLHNAVRFAVLTVDDAIIVKTYLSKILTDIEVSCMLTGTINPVLSKLKVNKESRYTL